MKKVFYSDEEYSDEEDDYGYATNVLGKSEICCDWLGEFIQYISEPLVYSNDWIYLDSIKCRFCPNCGTKIQTDEIEPETKLEYERNRKIEEKKWVAYLKGLPSKPKKEVKKMKKNALTEYQKVFDRYTLS